MPAKHLYIHVPFCARRCSYCDFSIAVRAATPVAEYIAALRTEFAQIVRRGAEARALETVYLGGGTPSRLGGPGVAEVIEAIKQHWPIAKDAELTVEANPDDINDLTVARWIAAGVNRVSLGAQSFDDAALQWMHRTHDSGQIGEAVETLRRGGIDNISLDLIFSLPAHLGRSWRNDLDRAMALEPGHLSLYGLTVEPMTPLGRWVARGDVVQGGDEGYEEEFLLAHERLTAAGFEHYEVSNFGRRGRHSRHNSAYWTGAPYLAAGPSAHSFDGAIRRWNIAAYAEWIRRLAKDEAVIAGEEMLTAENKSAEEIYLGLRTTRGLRIQPDELPRIRIWEAAGWATITNNSDTVDKPNPLVTSNLVTSNLVTSNLVTSNLVTSNLVTLTPLGWLRLDSLAADLAARRSLTTAVA